MKILVLSFYFDPDLSAGAFRATALVKALIALDPELEVNVVTTLPNRYSSFVIDAPESESKGRVFIRRIALPPHRSGMFDQSKAFVRFARRTRQIIKDEEYDLVFATSSRLMTAVLGAWVAWCKAVPLYLDIRDIFVDTIKDVLPRRAALVARTAFDIVERWTIGRATKVNLVSEGFREYFESRYPGKRFSFFTNGIDDEFVAAAPQRASAKKAERPLVAVYAGNLGEGQGMHLILPGLAKRTAGKVHFKIFGDGGRKDQLLKALEAAEVANVEIFAPVDRDRLIEEYERGDILFLHLNKVDAFKKVLPSKVFEYGALGKPIWAGVPGFSADFIRREIDNVAVFSPCDVEAAILALSQLEFETRPRQRFIDKYSRSAISIQMARDILTTDNASGVTSVTDRGEA